MKTAQEIFDIAAKHLLSQGRRSLSASGHCAYRSADGLKCAIGALIDDSDYLSEMEGKGVNRSDAVCAAAGIDKDERRLAFELQLIHDHSHVKSWRDELADIAAKFGLKMVDTYDRP